MIQAFAKSNFFLIIRVQLQFLGKMMGLFSCLLLYVQLDSQEEGEL